jgi:myo-inositol 2-dehydrogenase/D-chiro-inositol 1-dehydrogenase
MLAERRLDGVMVVGPPKMHLDVGRKVLDRGLALFVEKPPAPDLASAEELVRLAEARGAVLMTGFMKRFALAHRKILGLIDEGRFLPSAGLFRYTHWAGRDLRAMLLTMAIHPIDLAVAFFGRPVEVASFTYDSGGALCVGLTLRFESGRWAELMLGCHGPRVQERVELSGVFTDRSGARKDGCFVVDDIVNLELHTAGGSGVDLLAPSLSEIGPAFDLDDIRAWRPDFAIPNMGQNSLFLAGYAGEVREFADALVEKRAPRPGGADCLAAMRVIEAVCARPDGTSEVGP